MTLLSNMLLIRTSGATVAGTTEVDGGAIDMANCDSVVFIASLATVADTGVVTLTAQGRDTTSGSWNDLAATVSHTAVGAETARLIALEVNRPMVRYVRVKVTRTVANTAIDAIVALVTPEGSLPVTQSANVNVGIALSPA